MCRDCGYVLPCPNCDISLTLHMDTKTMRCHYCGHEEKIPHRCPSCHADKIRYYGTGTQKVEEELIARFPEARVLRMDVDTTRKKEHMKNTYFIWRKESRHFTRNTNDCQRVRLSGYYIGRGLKC